MANLYVRRELGFIHSSTSRRVILSYYGGNVGWQIEFYYLGGSYASSGPAQRTIDYWKANGLCLDLAKKAELIIARDTEDHIKAEKAADEAFVNIHEAIENKRVGV